MRLLTSWRPRSREIRRGPGQDIVLKSTPSDPLPPTSPPAENFYHLSIMSSNFESINEFIHLLGLEPS
jgi:hypothetical protein